jgi:hypothetical protein
MKTIKLDSNMSERSAGRPVSPAGYKKRDYVLYEFIGDLFAMDFYRNKGSFMSAVGIYAGDVKPINGTRAIGIESINDSRRPEVEELLKRRGYNENIAFM